MCEHNLSRTNAFLRKMLHVTSSPSKRANNGNKGVEGVDFKYIHCMYVVFKLV